MLNNQTISEANDDQIKMINCQNIQCSKKESDVHQKEINSYGQRN